MKHFGEIGVQEFSSNLPASRRQAILNDFKYGRTQIIICSDAMARGLDVPAVKYVISYDPPVSSKTHVHRVGRTARAGKTGKLADKDGNELGNPRNIVFVMFLCNHTG